MTKKKLIPAHEPLSEEVGPNGGSIWTAPVTPMQAQAPLNAMPKLTPTTNDQLAVPPSPFQVKASYNIPDPQVPVDPQSLKVALIGTAPSSRLLAPFDDPTWQIWACSPGNMGTLPRVDIWFEIHCNLMWPEHKSYGEPYLEWLRKQKFPIYMQDQSQVAHAITFPKDELVKEFGKDFFTSSFTWMMALAIHKGAKEIALYGIDMASRDEYILQRPGFFFFRHEAEKRGIKISAPNESDIMQSPPLYGYSDKSPFSRKMQARRGELRMRLDQMRAERDKFSQNITYLEGALEDNDYTLSIWAGVGSI